MRFDLIDFAVFDCFILRRAGSEEDYSESILDIATKRFAVLSDADRKRLSDRIVAGLPGANERWSLEDVKRLLEVYAGMTRQTLRAKSH